MCCAQFFVWRICIADITLDETLMLFGYQLSMFIYQEFVYQEFVYQEFVYHEFTHQDSACFIRSGKARHKVIVREFTCFHLPSDQPF